MKRWPLGAWLLLVSLSAAALDGVVRDAATALPIAGATVVAGDASSHTDDQGRFDLGATLQARRIAARAPGYARHEQSVPASGPLVMTLAPLRPKALYLSAYGVGNASLRGEAVRLIGRTELNALVIDVKGDRGVVPYRSAAVQAAGVTQPFVTVADMPALLKTLRAQVRYLIARIVVFKDDPLAAAQPQWAVHTARGALWRDREGLRWIDPFRRDAWERHLALAEEAAQLGFDEVQFDYLRFPDATGLVFSEPDTEQRRVAAINGFLDAARQRLRRYNVFVAADIFGYVTWNRNDTHIGQQLEAIAPHVDYLSPMLYPSGYQFGIPGHRNPVAVPYDIVYESLQRAQQRSGLPGLRFRPWLQAFRDYAFDRRIFGAHEIRQQIRAAEASGSNGWMLWNPHNRYSDDGLEAAAPMAPSLTP